MPLALDFAVAKTHKHATRESGDTAEIVERPGGGLSLLVVDGQGSGRGARVISQMVAARCLAAIKDGVRDGVVARIANDVLLAHRHGQVSATLDLVSVDVPAGEIVVTRQGGTVGALRRCGETEPLATATPPLGRYRLSRPVVWRYPLAAGLTVVVATDGISASGQRLGQPPLDLPAWLDTVHEDATAEELADQLLAHAVSRDGGRPSDDCTVGVVRIVAREDVPVARRMAVYLPLP